MHFSMGFPSGIENADSLREDKDIPSDARRDLCGAKN
jgi:hypothetical protein